jgi:hypothetical protein
MLPLDRDGEAGIGDTVVIGDTDGEVDIGAMGGEADTGGRVLLRE